MKLVKTELSEKQELILKLLAQHKSYVEITSGLYKSGFGDLTVSMIKEEIDQIMKIEKVKTEYILATKIERKKWADYMNPIIKKSHEDDLQTGFVDGTMVASRKYIRIIILITILWIASSLIIYKFF